MSAQQTNIFTDFTQAVSDFTLEGLNFDAIVNNFHFIRPWWLLAFFALFLVLFLLKRIRYYQSPWQHFLPSHLANALLENSHNQSGKTTHSTKVSSQTRYWLKPTIMGCCIIFALAGPAWQKLPQPVYQLERGAVLIMDMSYSMYATDVKPNRLTRARYKAIDLLKKINEGDVGLIAYAGDAFIISPLTQDIKNIELLLPSLSPDIMPIPGANALAALILADQTLKNSGHISGDIYWFTDDIDNEEMSDVYDWANDNNHKVNILGVGSKTGAPIKLSSGELLKDNRGAIVIPKLPESRLSAIAQRGRGVYQTMTNDDADIKALTAHLSVNLDDSLNSQTSNNSNEAKSKQAIQGDQYQEQGPWLLLIILPLLLSYFRRGTSILVISWLMPLTLLFSFTTFSPNSYATESNNSQNSAPSAALAANTEATQSTSESNGKPINEPNVSGASQLWQDLWQTSDQQAQQHYQQKDYQQAAKQFDDSQWQGSAHYKAGDYEQALQAFQKGDSAQAFYNQGNSLAQLQKVDEAIEAYKKALEKDPNLEDAKDNLAKLEALKKQQEEQQSQGDQENQDSEEQSKDDQQEQKDNKDDQQSQDGQKKSEEPSEDDQQQSNSEDQKGEQQDDQKDDQKEQEAKQKEQEQKEQEQKEQEEQAAQAKESDEEQKGEQKSLAQQAIDSKAQETEQKHQQLLNKVTDDPYLLLRNKMRLEYQKRRNEGASQGVTKKW